jgi:hypothetical protein
MHQPSAAPSCPRIDTTPGGMPVVAGDPVRCGDRELTPLVGVTTYRHRRAFVGELREGACSRGVAHLRPVGVVVRDGHAERTLPVHDWTSRILALLNVAVVLVPVALAIATPLIRSRNGRLSGPRCDDA